MDPNDIKSTQDRDHFRVDDKIIVQMYIPLVSELNMNKEEIQAKLCSQQESDRLKINEEFQKMSEKVDQAITLAAKDHAVLTNIAKLLNQKIDLVSSIHLGDMNVEPKKVNISTGGVGFEHDKEFAINTIVFLKLVIPPKQYTILVKSRVVNCRYLPKKNPDKPFFIGFTFINLTSIDESFLNKYIMDKQIEARNKPGQPD